MEAKGWASRVRVPAVSVPVAAMRKSEMAVVAKLVLSLPLLPVRVAAVPLESETENDLAA